MSYLALYWMFFKIGLFTIGGGLAALPLMLDALVKTGMLSGPEFYDMFAISQSTPGPIGINLATFVGYRQLSYSGAFVATLGMVSPSIVVIYLIAKFMGNFDQNPYVRRAMRGFRVTAVGLIATAAYHVIVQSVLDLPALKALGAGGLNLYSLGLFALLATGYYRYKPHPILCLGLGCVGGLVLF
jgi:chromate transporter